MKFYKSISDYYEHIFPYNPLHKQFIEESTKEINKKKILDIGCATGELSIHLANSFEQVYGIDLDEEMIKKAKSKTSPADKVQFLVANMLKLSTHFEAESFDIVSCFGNTIVHLQNEDLVLDFFKEVHKHLRKGGKFLFQIINYDRIIDEQIDSLPLIENQFISFERNYQLHEDKSHVDFQTELLIKETDEIIQNSIPLLCLRKGSVKKLLEESGFKNISFFGNFRRKASEKHDQALIFEAKK